MCAWVTIQYGRLHRFSSPLLKNVVNHLIQTVDLKASVFCVTASCLAQEPDMSEYIWNSDVLRLTAALCGHSVCWASSVLLH